MLTIPLDRIAAIVATARDCERMGEASEDDELEDREDDERAGGLGATLARNRLLKLISALDRAELSEVLALTWMGRGDFEPEALPEAIRQAGRIISVHPAQYLANLPDLAEHLKNALGALGVRLGEYAGGRG